MNPDDFMKSQNIDIDLKNSNSRRRGFRKKRSVFCAPRATQESMFYQPMNFVWKNSRQRMPAPAFFLLLCPLRAERINAFRLPAVKSGAFRILSH